MEYIKTNVGVEQDLIINYKDQRLRFEIKFNDYFNYWFIDIFDDILNTPIMYAIKIKLIYDCFNGLGLNLGELYLIDTINDNSTYDIKTDFGNRLKLARVYNA
jgi:hypothetical protein